VGLAGLLAAIAVQLVAVPLGMEALAVDLAVEALMVEQAMETPLAVEEAALVAVIHREAVKAALEVMDLVEGLAVARVGQEAGTHLEAALEKVDHLAGMNHLAVVVMAAPVVVTHMEVAKAALAPVAPVVTRVAQEADIHLEEAKADLTAEAHLQVDRLGAVTAAPAKNLGMGVHQEVVKGALVRLLRRWERSTCTNHCGVGGGGGGGGGGGSKHLI